MVPAAPVVRPLARISVLVVVPLLIALGASTAAGAVDSTVAKPSNAKQQPARPISKAAAPRAPQTTTTTTGTAPAPLSRTPATAILLSHIAHTYTVRKLNDLSNGTTCGVNCTLRNAINKANATPGVDLIRFAKIGTITLNATYGSLNPTTSMVIQGLGAGKTIVSGLSCTCTVFDLSGASPVPTVEIDGMKITKGANTNASVGGGGVRVGLGSTSDSAAILDHVVITGNDSVSWAGGIDVDGYGSQLWLTNSIVSANTADWGAGITFYYGAGMLSNDVIGGAKPSQGNVARNLNNSSGGGGIYNDDGAVSIYNTHVDHNKSLNQTPAYQYAGGIYSCCYTMTFQGGSISHNTVVSDSAHGGYGGGIYLDSSDYPVQLDGVAVNGNSIKGGYGEGGGIYNGSELHLTGGSTVNSNTITLLATGDSGYGAGISDEYQVQMLGGSISGNQIVRDIGVTSIYGYGGGFYEDDHLSLVGVTVAGNFLKTGAGYPYGAGGYSDNVGHFSRVTFTGNHANGLDAYGAGLYLSQSYATQIAHSTFSNNVIGASAYGEGAAIDSEGDDLLLSDVKIIGTQNIVSAGYVYGGVVYCGYQCAMDSVSISNSTIDVTGAGEYIYGGVVYSYYYPKWSHVSIKATTNTVHGAGGYIYGGVGYLDDVTEISDLTVQGTKNTAGAGGSIDGGVFIAYYVMELNNATFSGTTNKVPGAGGYLYGGVIYDDAQANYTRVKAIGTIDTLPGDGSYVYGGVFQHYDYVTSVNESVVGTTVTVGKNGYVYGGAIEDEYMSTFDRITVAGTTVTATGATSYIYGGALYLYTGQLWEHTALTNSTIASNHVKSPGTGAYGGFGGAIYADNAPLMLTNVTISGNTAGHGGGVYAYVLPTTFHNSIVSGNSRNCSASGGGTIVSAGHNLEKGTTCHFNQAGDLNTPAGLGLLKNNGGFAATMMPKPGSLAINHAANAGCPAVDERGVPRPQHRICDIGAVEVK
jgi:hypothetical protein